MEYFEKAHVNKKALPKRGKKAQKNVKSRLKQMLLGYKKCNNEIIKTAAGKNTYFIDDSISIHSYSDLESNIDNNALLQDSSLSTISISSKLSTIPDTQETVKQINESKSIESDALNSSDDSQPFDVDGSLAAIILNKLGSKYISEDIHNKKVLQTSGKAQKGKREKADVKGKIRKKEKRSKKQTKLSVEKPQPNVFNNNVHHDPYKLEEETSESDLDCLGSIIDIYNSSPPNRTHQSPSYVSIVANVLPNEDLGDILGDYKHATVKNISIDPISFNTLNTGLFSSEIDECDVQIQEPNEVINSSTDNSIAFNVECCNQLNTGKTSINTNAGVSAVLDVSAPELIEEQCSSGTLDSSHIETVKVFYNRNSCIFVLKHPVELYIHGKVKIANLAGTTEIFGHTLRESCEVYASNYNYALCLRTVENENDYYGLFHKLISMGLSSVDSEEIVTSLGYYDGVIHLQPLMSRKVDFVENNITVDLFSKIDKNIEGCFQRASKVLGCSLYLNRPWRCFEEDLSWSQILNLSPEQRIRGLVCGGKGVGKSTFLRYYVNRLLSSGPVLVIDLDPGQCEFTVAGNVSATVVTEPIVGPNFTHLRTPDRILNIGIINVMDNLRQYTNAVSDLISYCTTKEEYKNIPWIVNTMGMCNVLGLKLLTYTILNLQPTFLLQMHSRQLRKRFEYLLNADKVKSLYIEEYQNDQMFKNLVYPENLDYYFVVSEHFEEDLGKVSTPLAPRHERYLNYLAYFGELLDIHKADFLKIIPYKVPLQVLQVASNIQLDETTIWKVLNGKIIGLCSQEVPADDGDATSRIFTLKEAPMICHGHGLIRGVDADKGYLYVTTPLSQNKLASVNTLVYADWAPELHCELELPSGTHLPYRTPTHQHQQQFMRIPRRRFNPLQLLKMTRNP